jgi:hypothetical protein
MEPTSEEQREIWIRRVEELSTAKSTDLPQVEGGSGLLDPACQLAEESSAGRTLIYPIRIEQTQRGAAKPWDASGAVYELSADRELAERVAIFSNAATPALEGAKAATPALEGAPMVEIVNTSGAPKEPRQGWFELEVQYLNGGSVHLVAMPRATMLQVKHAVAQAGGIPAFQQTLWAEGAEEELQNTSSIVDSGLGVSSKLFLIKGDAASWQRVMLSEPELFDTLGDFVALSLWREEGGYEAAGKKMEAKVAEWEKPSSGLSDQEILRRKVVVGRFFVDCGGQYERAIELLQAAAFELEKAKALRAYAVTHATSGSAGEGGTDVTEDVNALPPMVQARLHMVLGAAYQAREVSKGKVKDQFWVNHKCAVDQFQRAVDLWRGLVAGGAGDEGATRAALAESLRGVGVNCTACTTSQTLKELQAVQLHRGDALDGTEREAMARRAEETNREALVTYQDMQHSELGSMFKVMGTMYHGKYRAAVGYRAGQRTGPQHDELGEKAIEVRKV